MREVRLSGGRGGLVLSGSRDFDLDGSYGEQQDERQKKRTNSHRAVDCACAYRGSRLCGSYSLPSREGVGALSMSVRKFGEALNS